MPITMEVDIRGADMWRLRLSNPAAVRAPIRRFLTRSANVARPAVMANILVGATGRARRSVKIKMQAGRYQVRVLSKLFYIRFLEHGTKRGILPRLMFARAAEAIQPQVQQFAREMVQEIVGKMQRG